MTLRVAVDTNVLVSALIADGPPSRVVEEAIDGRVVLLVPEPVLAELERVLADKLGFAGRRAREARLRFAALSGPCPAAPEPIERVSGDSDDDLVLASAIAAGADVLVTGDRKHLLPLGSHRGVRLLSPQELLADLRRSGT
ncbi:MAG: putative toxin-antitoxin system toxin component, PIN family [Candidatus Dormibacterales bacterium]